MNKSIVSILLAATVAALGMGPRLALAEPTQHATTPAQHRAEAPKPPPAQRNPMREVDHAVVIANNRYQSIAVPRDNVVVAYGAPLKAKRVVPYPLWSPDMAGGDALACVPQRRLLAFQLAGAPAPFACVMQSNDRLIEHALRQNSTGLACSNPTAHQTYLGIVQKVVEEKVHGRLGNRDVSALAFSEEVLPLVNKDLNADFLQLTCFPFAASD